MAEFRTLSLLQLRKGGTLCQRLQEQDPPGKRCQRDGKKREILPVIASAGSGATEADSMAITVRIGSAEHAQCHRALMDTGAQVNLISQSLVKELGLGDDAKSFTRVTVINVSSLFIYGTHQIDIQVVGGTGVAKAYDA